MVAKPSKEPLSPSASDMASKEPTHDKTPSSSPAEVVSPGSPPAVHVDRKQERDDDPQDDGDDAVGFGPPPAFPSAKSGPMTRKRTLMAVSASAGGTTRLEDLSSEEDENGDGKQTKQKQSQLIHRIKGGDGEANSSEKTKSGEDDKNKYNDAMLLASLSDVEHSPKKSPSFVEDAAGKEEQQADRSGSPKGGISETSSSAHTPLRSNVKLNPKLESVKPYTLLPKPKTTGFTSIKESSPAPQSPDGRDPKSAKSKNEKGAREGYAAQPRPQVAAYPTGYYPYPSPYGAPPYSAAAAYPTGYPYMGYHPHPHGPPGSMAPSPYHPRAYYPPGHPQGAAPAPPTPKSTSAGVEQPGPVSPEKWGQYHSPKQPERKSTDGPEPVRSSPTEEQPPFHPLSTTESHVVPSEDGDAKGAEGAYSRPPPPAYGSEPPPPGYLPESRYGPPPPTSEGYYPGPPPSMEASYNAISRDENSPPRSSASSHPRGPPAEAIHPPADGGTPPRGGPYEYYPDQARGAPPGAYGPGPGYHPDSPPSSYGHPHYGRGPPPPGASYDPYEPYDYNAVSSPQGSEVVPASVSNETEPHSHYGVKYHQFRKGGRSIHSEPIILRKKFSWRNYPELEDFLIANRTEYLRHSALNYTAEQKHFNNRLTEGLLELAAKLNYVFDETCFNFVAVRDRIRCYYKSYVQSSKKRGIVVGSNKNGAPSVKRARQDGWAG